MPRPALLTAIAAVSLAGMTAAGAALAPNYQRARELSAVVDAVAAAVESYPIDAVTYRGDHLYEVVAGPCTVQATIVPEPTPGIAGPMKFRVEPDEPQCTE
jgi:hypothetical protein